MSDEIAADRFDEVQDLKRQTVRQHGEIRQLEEKVETLTQQKHSLEQSNIGLKRDLTRTLNEVEVWKRNNAQLIDECAVATLNKQLVEEQLEGLRLSIQQFMEKYTK